MSAQSLLTGQQTMSIIPSISASDASFTWKRFNQKERFILIFNVCLHGDVENDHKYATGCKMKRFRNISKMG